MDPRPTVPLPGRWTFWAETMIGRQILGMVDVASFYCVRRLSAFGHGNVTVNLPCGLESSRVLALWSWRLWAFYDGQPYWCGVPTGIADQDGSAHVQLTLIELPGYLTRRQWEHWPDKSFTQEEQTEIARDIARPAEDVGVVIETDPGPGELRDRRYEFLEGGSRGQLLINLTGVIDGPEYRTEYRMRRGPPGVRAADRLPAGRRRRRRARPVGARGDPRLPGQLDSDQLRTVTYAVGDLPHDAGGEDEARPPRPCVIARVSGLDLPQLDMVDDWPGHGPARDLARAGRDRRRYRLDARPAGHRQPARVVPADHELRAGRHGDRAGRHPAGPARR